MKKKMKLRLAALALLVACLVPVLSGCDMGLIKMGYIDKEGNTVIQGLFQMTQPFHEGLAGVMLGRGDQLYWGFTDKEGNAIIGATLQSVRPFYEGLAPVCKYGNKYNYWVFIDEKGNEVFGEQEFGDASVFVDGLAPVQDMDTEKYGFIDRDGNMAIDYQFDMASIFSATDGLAMYRVGGENLGRCGYIDRQGNTAIAPAYYYAGTFNDGVAVVKETNDMDVHDWAMINTQGEVLASGFAELGGFSEGVCPAAVAEDGNTLWGFVDSDGEWVIEPQFAGAISFAEGLAGAQSTEDGKHWGYIDKTGAWVIEPKYDGVGEFSEGLAAVHGGDLVIAK